MKYLSVCSGIEAATVAWEPLGWKPVAFAEIEPFPSAVLAHHWPDVPNLGDMTKFREWDIPWEDVDVLVGGTPCFTAGHMVLREDGYVPIEDVRPGDMVVTHKGRLQRVVRTGSKIANVGVLSVLGRGAIVCTPEHPFLTASWRNQNTRRNGDYARIEHCDSPKWTAAEKSPGMNWCSLTSLSVPIPDLSSSTYVLDDFEDLGEGDEY